MYEVVTADEFEHVICFGRTTRELAVKLGVNNSTITHAVKSGAVSRKMYNKTRYKIVEVDDE